MKGDTVYYEKNGKYYKQNLTWWEKGGYLVPQTPKQISKEEYERMTTAKQEEEKGETI